MRRPSPELIEALRAATAGGYKTKKHTVYGLCEEVGVDPLAVLQFFPRRKRWRRRIQERRSRGGKVGQPPRSIPSTGRGGKGPSKIETDILKLAARLGVPKSRAIIEDKR